VQSATADNIIWARYADTQNESVSSVSPVVPSRIEFRELATPVPLHATIQEANKLSESRKARLVAVVGRSRRLAVESHQKELQALMKEYGNVGSEVSKTVGDVASAFVVAGCGCGLVVIQAASVALD
jgi:hypothetical protein